MNPCQGILVVTWAVLMGAAAPSSAADASESNPRDHWSFQPPTRPSVPRIANPTLPVRNPIDAFLFAEHEKRGLKPSQEVRKELLLRRVFLDLIGLPPTREELRSFLSDASADAYEKTVDRLLASEQYGVRWARHWMDIWRYADWYGRRHVPDVWNSAPQVWRWRDWIVRSLNTDKGYDRMLIEMLAADEVAPEDDSARVATGYLVRNWYALNPNQWMRDVVEHTGKAFLGLTFNCAHCHDHKYDPLTQRDYFQFRAYFEPIQVRQDRVPGEPDPGLFQKYEYTVTRKVITNGMVSVFDENLDAKTFLYLRGDERSFPDGKPVVGPAMPAFLGGDRVEARRMDLPAVARYPGLKSFIQDSETRHREQSLTLAKEALVAAEKALNEARARLSTANAGEALEVRARAYAESLAAEVTLGSKSNQLAIAVAELEAIRARIAADQAQYHATHGGETDAAQSAPPEAGHSGNGKETSSTATACDEDTAAVAASRAERRVGLRKAEAKVAEARGGLALLQAERAIADGRRQIEGSSEKKEEKDKGEAELKKAQERVQSAEKNLETARTALSSNTTVYTPLTPVYPAQTTGRRSALARWIVSRDNPLAARVAVNHVWARHLHMPLVASVYDFGRNGAAPTHPELLDWLAVEFMEQGWSLKHLHRLIVTSTAYRMISHDAPPEGQGSGGSLEPESRPDPENRYLWRMNPGQMEAEVLRDSILHVAGDLDLTPAAYPIPNAQAERSRARSLYFECFPEPGGQSAFAELFDPPDSMECYRRTKTIVPQQALALANSKLSDERSRTLATRLAEQIATEAGSEETAFVGAAYEQVLTRRPTDAELAVCRDFLASRANAGQTESAARAGLIRVLFNHNDFVTIR